MFVITDQNDGRMYGHKFSLDYSCDSEAYFSWVLFENPKSFYNFNEEFDL